MHNNVLPKDTFTVPGDEGLDVIQNRKNTR